MIPEPITLPTVVDIFLLLLIGIGPKLALVPFLKSSAGADERDQVRGVHGAPAGLGGLFELKRHGNAGGGGAGPKGNGARMR
jgi:hypothetical protein